MTVRRVLVNVCVLALTLALGGGAVAGCLLLLVPAASPLAHLSTTGHAPPLVLAPLSQRSFIYDRNGNLMQALYSNEDRDPVKLADVPAQVINAVLDTEDRNFFQHAGVDWKGIGRAFYRDIQAGSLRQGGSTITQQLVKNTLFVGGRKRTAHDKIHEAVLALRLEHDYSKQDILERYLNTVYFGRGAYGLKAAAERWFNLPDVQRLTIPDAALLAGMIRDPGAFDPIAHPQAARDRRLQVLQFMAEQGHLTWPEVDRYATARVPTKTYSTFSQIAPQSYFVDAVQDYLVNQDNPASRALGDSVTARRYQLYHGGVKITTTFDQQMQAYADEAVATKAPPYETNHKGGPIDVGMAVIDNTTGAVRAIEGGHDYGTSKFDLATQCCGFQPGSSFKTFTLTAALESGYSPDDTVNGSASCTFQPPLVTGGVPYTVHADGSGVMRLRTAIAESINCAFLRLIIALGADAPSDLKRPTAGPDRVIEVAKRLGVAHAHLEPNTSLTLGTSTVTPLDMAAAYSTIAAGGVRHDPTFVTRIVGPDGTVLFDQPGSRGQPVLSPQVAATVTDMLKGVLAQPGATAYGKGLGRPAAGKTGTTDSRISLWFVGYTPQITTAVAIAKPRCQNTQLTQCSLVASRLTDGYGIQSASQAFGGQFAASIWQAFMLQAVANLPPLDFAPPNPALWPSPRYFDENGRRSASYTPPSTPDTSTSTTTPGATTTTSKPGKSTTTTTVKGPPATKP